MLILLDIDGVMVPANSWRRPEILADGFSAFSGRAVCALQHILDETGATIVLTTSHKSSYDLPKWRDLFSARGIRLRKLDALADNRLHLTRKDEVMNWFRKENPMGKNTVIIDDDKSLNDLPSQLKEKLILTSGSVGLTQELADRAISVLQRAESAIAG